MADKYLSAAGKRRRLYINTIKVFDELMANICRQKTSSDYSCHSTASPIELTPEEETEIIRNFILYSSSTLSEDSYKVRCFGAENGAYAVFVEPDGYSHIDFEDYLEKPYSTPMTRESFGSSDFDFWYEIGDPFLIYKDGEFYRLRKAWETGIITGAFLSEVNDRYKTANPGFYDYNH